MGNSLSASSRKAKPKRRKTAALLEDTRLADICSRQSIVTLKDDATVEQALQVGLAGARGGGAAAAGRRDGPRRRTAARTRPRAWPVRARRHGAPHVGAPAPARRPAHRRPAAPAPRPHPRSPQMLAQKRILSAPVKLSGVPDSAADGTGATIFGFVDVRDIVSSFFKSGEGNRRGACWLQVAGCRAGAGGRQQGRGHWGRRPRQAARSAPTPRPRPPLLLPCCRRRGTPAELQGVDLKSMKMLQRMRLLDEKGEAFAEVALKDLPIIGGRGGVGVGAGLQGEGHGLHRKRRAPQDAAAACPGGSPAPC
jgi:hypothetical protein